MELKYLNIHPKHNGQTATKSFISELKLIDNKLDVAFNRVSGRWEVYRLSNKGWQWILVVENEDESYRPLDNRVLKKLREIDIIARYGSVAGYERHLEEKLKKYKNSIQKDSDHELQCDIKDDKVLWHSAMENFKSGKI